MLRRWMKILAAAVLVIGLGTGFVGLSPTASADTVELAGVDIDDDGVEGDDDDLRVGFAVVIVLLIGTIWFFGFRGGEDDTGFNPEVDSEPSIKKEPSSSPPSDDAGGDDDAGEGDE